VREALLMVQKNELVTYTVFSGGGCVHAKMSAYALRKLSEASSQ
jgi:hypothetical protein